MANDFSTVKITADVSGVVQGVGRADASLSAFGATLREQNKNVVKFGGAIQRASGPHGIMGIKPKAQEASASIKAFENNVQNLNKSMGPSRGLRRNINDLETPLRDVEGSFDRVAMATRVWGNASETASEKATVGFLLAADTIATFASGGVAGIAIAAAVAGFSLLSKALDNEAEAARKAEEETKKQAEALQALADAALSAGVSLAAQRSLQEVTQQSTKLLEVDDKLLNNRREQIRLLKALGVREDEQNRLAFESGILVADVAAKELEHLEKVRKPARQQLRKLREDERLLLEAQEKAATDATDAAFKASQARARFNDSATKVVLDNTKKIAGAIKSAVTDVKKAGNEKTDDFTAVAEDRLKNLEAERRLDLQVAADNRAADRADAKADAEWDLNLQKEEQKKRFELWAMDAKIKAEAEKSADKIANDSAKMRAETIKSTYETAANAVTSQLFNMAKAGEFSFGKLAEAATMAAGQSLVSEGTRVLLLGIAKLFNPKTLPVGIAEAKHGSVMIGTGLAMGAVGGAVSRATAAPGEAAAGASSTPTDTRQTRAASSAADGGGGTTVININGDVFDKRGVANVLTSGQKMARHRRIAGA